jgi:hypothetical protein
VRQVFIWLEDSDNANQVTIEASMRGRDYTFSEATTSKDNTYPGQPSQYPIEVNETVLITQACRVAKGLQDPVRSIRKTGGAAI